MANKLSVAIADSTAAQNAFVVFRGFAPSIEKAAALGYDAVELALCRAEEVDERMLETALGRHNMRVSAISTGQTYAKLGLYLTDPDTEGRGRAVSVISDLIRLAGRYGNMVNLGRARGFIGEGQSYSQTEALAMDSMLRLVETAEGCGVDLVIEPLNRYETNFINTLDECAALIERIGSARVGMMPDVFHMNIEERGVGEALRKHRAHVRYIHLADSNRRAPGWGHLDFLEVRDAIRAMEYTGYLTVEIFPLPDPDSAARQAVEFLRPLFAG